MKNHKVCSTVDDLVCTNCLYVSVDDDDMYCHFDSPDFDNPEPSVHELHWCGMGLWQTPDRDTGEVRWSELHYAVADLKGQSMLKTCTQIEDLTCSNCIYSAEECETLYCLLHPPKGKLIVVNDVYSCSYGQWYCELHRSKDDTPGPSPMYRTSGKSMAVSSFLDRIRESR